VNKTVKLQVRGMHRISENGILGESYAFDVLSKKKKKKKKGLDVAIECYAST
jgi:hypothetical protein